MLTALTKWNEREREHCVLCDTFEREIQVWRVYIGKAWRPFSLPLCMDCHCALVNHEEADDITFGIGLEVLDRLKRRLPEPQFTKAWGFKEHGR